MTMDPATADGGKAAAPDAEASGTEAAGDSAPGLQVFLCHNSRDKAEVKAIAERLRQRGLRPWLDEWEIRPGEPLQRTLDEQIRRADTAAVFVGERGFGPWQREEAEGFLYQFVDRGCPVIPVILESCRQPPELPIFLSNRKWVDFRRRTPDPLEALIWGITGRRPAGFPPPAPDPQPRRRRLGALLALLLVLALALTAWMRLRPPAPDGPCVLFSPSVFVSRFAEREGNDFRFEMAHNGDTVPLADGRGKYRGETVWLGCVPEVRPPQRIVKRWRGELEAAGETDDELLTKFLSPRSILPPAGLAAGDRVAARIVKGKDRDGNPDYLATDALSVLDFDPATFPQELKLE